MMIMTGTANLGTLRNQQTGSHIYVYDNIIWEESLCIRRRVVDSSIGRVY
jgi:hypothetical protein